MPDVALNYREWNDAHAWPEAGGEWSIYFGDTEALWQGRVFPRIQSFVPANHILEIAPGHGRFTHYLQTLGGHLTIVDLSDKCIATCRKRFADVKNITYHVNDGRSLWMIPPESVDFAFSFDSLVHCETDIVGAYLKELSRVLTPDGVAFLHHSNLGAYRPALWPKLIPSRWRWRVQPFIDPDHWRAPSMSAKRFQQLCSDADLVCIDQECVTWGTKRLIDCFSICARQGRPGVVRETPSFAPR